MLELRNKLLLLGLEVEASLIPTFTLDPRLIGGVCGELFLKDLKQLALMSASNWLSNLLLWPKTNPAHLI